jgi:hypothetical protein
MFINRTRHCRCVWGLLALSLSVGCLLSMSPVTCRAADNDRIQPVFKQQGPWDGQWTDASSGYHYSWPDPGDSTNKSGNKPKDFPEHYWIPPARQFEDVDPEQSALNQRWHYTPFGQLMVWQTLTLPTGQTVDKGYYQIRVGQYDDGSPKTRLSDDQRTQQLTNTPVPPNKRPPRNVFELEDRIQRQSHVMILYRVGKVVAVLPIMERLPVAASPTFERPSPVARVKTALAHPVDRLSRTRALPKVPEAKLTTFQNQLWVEVADGRMTYRTRVG